ncbi:hypothetical protein [Amycolatopsis iheyensis]|uniref:hypothetical protein n=1 Tax=Amycolatopsis iheyensis TaxID=2945988 RepID=UPI0035571C73
MHEAALRAAAFGSDPLPDPAALRGPGGPRERLLAAIVLGAQGRYAAAAALLDQLRRQDDPVLASLAASTRAAHLRQLGGHRQARALDGVAFAKAVGVEDGSGAPVGHGFAGRAAADREGAGGEPADRNLADRNLAGREPVGGTAAGRTAAGRTPASREPAGGTAPGRTAAGRDPAGRDPADLDLVGREPAGRTLTDHAPADLTPTGRTPAGRTAAGREPAGRTLTDHTPADLTPAGRTAAGRDPADPTLTNHAPADRDPDGLDAAGARADALLGLAADNLALGRLRAARRLADRAAHEDTTWRARVRGGWVGAEIELAAGQGAAAVPHARRAFETAQARGARRHAVKSGIVLAVALRAAGAPDHREISDGLVGNAMATAEECELLSLLWPAALVLADLRPGHAEEYRFRVAEVLHAVLRSADPCGRRIAGESPWVPAPGG